MIENIIVISAGLYLLLASINDIMHRFVHDYMTYSFGALFLVLRVLLFYETGEPIMLLSSLYVAAPTLLISYILYKAGAWGGGDLKLLTAMAIGVPFLTSHDAQFPFFANFLTNTLVTGIFFGIIWSLIQVVRNLKKVSKKISKTDLIIFLLFLITGVFFFTQNYIFKIFSIILLLFPITYMIKKVEYETQVIDKPVKNLEEGDWILEDIKAGRKTVLKKPTGLSKEDIALLQKTKLKTIKVRDGIPFVPSFFLGYLTAFYYGNLIFNFVGVLFTSI
ncbi:MAG: prepilin peptidase [Nanoarchaeota archaeon]|nr:prepilin peptidase [Nanoarchaeota archaeon]